MISRPRLAHILALPMIGKMCEARHPKTASSDVFNKAAFWTAKKTRPSVLTCAASAAAVTTRERLMPHETAVMLRLTPPPIL